MDAVKAAIHEKYYDKLTDFKRAFRGKGWHEWGSRISVKGTVTYVMYNEAAKVVLEGVPSARGEELLREWLVDMSYSDAM